MSRSYDFEVEIEGVNSSELARGERIIHSNMSCWALEGEQYGGSWIFRGSLSLGGGMDEREAHGILVEALREELPNAGDINTRWLCTEYRNWDQEFCDSTKE